MLVMESIFQGGHEVKEGSPCVYLFLGGVLLHFDMSHTHFSAARMTPHP